MSPDRFPWVEAVEQLYGVQTSLFVSFGRPALICFRGASNRAADAGVMCATGRLGCE